MRYGVGFKCRLDPHKTFPFLSLIKKYCDGEIPLTSEECAALRSIASSNEHLDSLITKIMVKEETKMDDHEQRKREFSNTIDEAILKKVRREHPYDLFSWLGKKEEIKMDDRTKKALLGSIEKWRKIVEGRGEDRGRSNCPLCVEFESRYCVGCPVFAFSGHAGCINTPYDDWKDHHCSVGPKKIECNKCVPLAKKELEFLESLLPKDIKEEQKMSEDKELKVMESRVKSAMEKCPAGKEILNELFYPEPKEEWRDITRDCKVRLRISRPIFGGLYLTYEDSVIAKIKQLGDMTRDSYREECGQVQKCSANRS